MRKVLGFLFLLTTATAIAAPSTVVWVPSTDTQPAKTWHYGQASFIAKDESRSVDDQALTYGLNSRVEVGIDVFSPMPHPVVGNVKVLITKPGEADVPVAVGIFNVGTSDAQLNSRVAYAVASKTIGSIGRFTAGGYTARKGGVGDENSGIMLGAEGSNGKFWYGVDYLSGDNALGSVNAGVCYSFNPACGVLVGYGKPNIGFQPALYTVQLGVNFM
jgi:hypothetical protein